ncbi:MAG: AAA family ATPase [Solirubrobacteraceae bacterium]
MNEHVAGCVEAVLDEVEKAVVGKRPALELVLLCLLADGHVLLEDVPGVAKTLIARSFATVMGLSFTRLQCTPDLMPADVTGGSLYDPATGTLSFRPGPVFTHVLLADEINRAHPKSQAALLEAMQERQVTTDEGTRALDAPFLVLATQNPIEFEGTYPLPEAQLDRFLARLAIGYPERDDEIALARRRAERGREDADLATVLDRATLLELQRAVEAVHVEAAVTAYIVDLARATRTSERTSVGASPRGTLALLRLARAHAAARGRDFVVPEDVKAVAVAALGHRVMLRPELWVESLRGEDVVRECLQQVPAPAPSIREGEAQA